MALKRFVPPPTLERFMLNDAFYRGVLGPVGSGKSSACCWEIMRRAQMQRPSTDESRKKVRRSRWAIIRNTSPQLRDTTIKTWHYWFPPESVGVFSKTDMSHYIRLGDIELEVMFRALDRPDDVRKLLSMELTGAWVNEAREVPLQIIQSLGDRVGRFPSMDEGGSAWTGVIMDTNPPDEDHWWYKFAEEDEWRKNHVEGAGEWAFYRQPGGLIEVTGENGEPAFIPNPHAENLEHLEPNYYAKRVSGKDTHHIQVYYCAQYGMVRDGKPVFPEFRDEIHIAKSPLEYINGVPLVLAWDFGNTPACVVLQPSPRGQLRVLREFVTPEGESRGIKQFAQNIVKPALDVEFPEAKYISYGDPAGGQKAQTDQNTCFSILRDVGIPTGPAKKQDLKSRQEAVRHYLTTMIDGMPGFIIDRSCGYLRRALAGKYCYRRLQVSGDERYHEVPDKNQYSHIADALQYACVSLWAPVRRSDERYRRRQESYGGGAGGY